ncbi:hypothetical protein FACS189430_11430 [Bacteroidia bacterium]|nr:hypothetical protein FACS189430_11430 [Bacteroidia bacterium]
MYGVIHIQMMSAAVVASSCKKDKDEDKGETYQPVSDGSEVQG